MDTSGLSSVSTPSEMVDWLTANCLTPVNINPVMTGADFGVIMQKIVSLVAGGGGSYSFNNGLYNDSDTIGVGGDFSDITLRGQDTNSRLLIETPSEESSVGSMLSMTGTLLEIALINRPYLPAARGVIVLDEVPNQFIAQLALTGHGAGLGFTDSTQGNGVHSKSISLGVNILNSYSQTPIPGILVTDTVDNIGFEYAADYAEANAGNPRWIPDKAYVDSVSGGTSSSFLDIRDPKTDNYTFGLTDAGAYIPVNSTAQVVLTIPAYADVPFQLGTHITVKCDIIGATYIGAAAGVAIQSTKKKLNTYATLINRAADIWDLIGDLSEGSPVPPPMPGEHIVWLNCTTEANKTTLPVWNNLGYDLVSNVAPYVSANFLDTEGNDVGWYWELDQSDTRLEIDTFSPPVPENPDYPDEVANNCWSVAPGVTPHFYLHVDPAKTYVLEAFIYDGDGNGTSIINVAGVFKTVNADTPNIYTWTDITPTDGKILVAFGWPGDGVEYGTLTAFKLRGY